MKSKPIFIIIGAIIVFVLILVWVYLLFFGTPKEAQNIFTNLTTGGEELINEEFSTEEDLSDNNETAKLRQLTTREVAGFREINSDSNPIIYYVEKGTGHIYSINPRTGEDVRVSGTTIPGTYSAEISPQGDYVAIGIKSNTKNTKLVVGKFSEKSDITTEDLDVTVDQFNIGDGEELLYAVRDDLGLAVFSYKFESGLIKNIFNIPFHEAVIQWGTNSNASHYFYPKTSYLLEGYLYEVNNQKISRLPVDGFGLSALANEDTVTYSTFNNKNSQSFIHDRNNNKTSYISIIMTAEKCAFKSISNVICADAVTPPPAGYPDNWYQGTVTFKDSLWLIDTQNSSVSLLTDTEKASGRHIDITNVAVGDSGFGAYFTNKNDNTLWIYEF